MLAAGWLSRYVEKICDFLVGMTAHNGRGNDTMLDNNMLDVREKLRRSFVPAGCLQDVREELRMSFVLAGCT